MDRCFEPVRQNATYEEGAPDFCLHQKDNSALPCSINRQQMDTIGRQVGEWEKRECTYDPKVENEGRWAKAAPA